MYGLKFGFTVLATSFALITSPASPAVAPGNPAVMSPVVAPAGSETILGWTEIAARNPKYIVFGEMHGTEESPRYFGEIALTLALNGERILVAVELSSAYNAALQEAWNGEHVGFGDRVAATDEWAGRKDGVASEAMLKMLSDLHAAKIGGANLAVVAFNGIKDDEQRARLETPGSQAGHEAAQTENIINAAKGADFDYVLILVGNLHAKKNPVTIGSDTFKPMATHLASAGTVVSLNMSTADGTMWNCIIKANVKPKPKQPITSDMIDCGNHILNGRPGPAITPDRINVAHLALYDPSKPGLNPDYDGYYWLGIPTGSPPARP
jgi:hypothetical protein